MISSRLEYLFDRYFDKTCTDQEKAELMFLLQDLPDMDLQQLVGRAYARRETDPGLPEHSADSILSAVFHAERSSAPVFTPLFFRRLTVAAALLLLSLGAYRWIQQHPKASPAAGGAIAFKNDLPPGHSGAILTLAGGATVLLDSAHNGAVCKQGSAQVVKQNGQLSYTALNGSHEVLYNTMTTPRGRQYQLVLADGSRVWLNSASSLRFPTAFTGKDRAVELTGEGYFEVADDAAHPFIVKTRNMDIHVMGTGFNVMAYGDEEATAATLVHGSVEIEAGNHAARIIPGQQANIFQGTLNVSTPDMTEVLAWKEGKFRFRKTGIKAIMRQIARWYDVDIVYKGDIPDVELSGVFPRTEYASQLLEVLEDADKIHFAMEGNTITVMAGAK
jgi:transmembrane sensor